MEVDLDVTTAAVCDLQTFALCDRVVLLQHCNCRSTTAGCGGPAEDGHLEPSHGLKGISIFHSRFLADFAIEIP